MKRSAYLVVQVAILSVMTTGVGWAGGGWEETIESQERQIEALETRMDLLRQQQDEIQSQQEVLAGLKEEVLRMGLDAARMEGQVHETRSDTRRIQEEFEEYRERYRISARIKAVGEKLPGLTTASGKSFSDVTIKKVTDAGLVIWHESGTTRLVFNDLPRKMRDRFQWDEAKAVVQLEQEADSQARRDEYLARQRRLASEKRQERAEKAAIDQRVASLERRLQAQQAAATRTSSLQTSGRLGETRTFGTGRVYPYRSSSYYSRSYGSRYYGYRDRRPTVTYYPVWNNNSSCGTRSRPVVRPPSGNCVIRPNPGSYKPPSSGYEGPAYLPK